MIIRNNKNIQKEKQQTEKKANLAPKTSSAIIKKEDVIKAQIEKQKRDKEKKEQEIQQEIEQSQVQAEEDVQQEIVQEPKQPKIEEFERIDITSIDFKERIERRRGDRRRGYRRIDERSLVSRAQQEAHNIKELASREGYNNGLERAKTDIDNLKEELKEFINSTDIMYDEFYPHVMEIALSAAEKIIKKEVSLSNDVLKEVIMSAMAELNSDVQKVEIKVNSDDVEFTKLSVPEFMETKGIDVRITVSGDDSIEKGSCIVIANNGVIDANFKTQLAILQNAFGIYKGGI